MKVKLRYNTLVKDNRLYWRILIDGKEYLASNVVFELPTETTGDLVWDEQRQCEVFKHHVSCEAKEVIWNGDTVIVK